MELLNRRSAFGVIAAAASILLSGCGSTFRIDTAASDRPSSWPYWRADLACTGTVALPNSADSLQLRWLKTFDDRPAGPLTILQQQLVYPGSKKRVRFLTLDSGAVTGYLRFSGPVSTGLVRWEQTGLVGLRHRKNQLLSVNLENGNQIWQVSFRDPVGGSILVKESWLVASADGYLFSVDPIDGSTNWKLDLKDRLAVGPTLLNDTIVLQPGRNGAIHVVQAMTGQLLSSRMMPHAIASAVVADSGWYATDVTGHVAAFSLTNDASPWTMQVNGGVWSSPALAGALLYVASTNGSIVCLQTGTGEKVWTYETGEVITAALTVAGDRLLAASKRGTVYLLDRTSGQLLDSKSIVGGISQSPTTDGRSVFVASDLGRVACFELK